MVTKIEKALLMWDNFGLSVIEDIDESYKSCFDEAFKHDYMKIHTENSRDGNSENDFIVVADKGMKKLNKLNQKGITFD